MSLHLPVKVKDNAVFHCQDEETLTGLDIIKTE